jgi:hypothetical protein
MNPLALADALSVLFSSVEHDDVDQINAMTFVDELPGGMPPHVTEVVSQAEYGLEDAGLTLRMHDGSMFYLKIVQVRQADPVEVARIKRQDALYAEQNARLAR